METPPQAVIGEGWRFLFDFLLQILEQRRVEKVLNGDLQAIADLFDGVDLGILIVASHDVAQCGLGNSTYQGQAIDGNQILSTQIQYSLADGFTYGHDISPNFIRLTSFYKGYAKSANLIRLTIRPRCGIMQRKPY